MGKIELIQQAIDRAERLESKLTPKQFEIGGFTGEKIRHLLNNLGEISTNYLEIGVLFGSTFVAANYGNNFNTSIAIDSFVEFNEDKTAKKQFINNAADLRYILLDQDCWTVPVPFTDPIDFYTFDGAHDFLSQEKALTYFKDAMADEFIFCLDDANWPEVINGTRSGIEKAGLQILAFWELGPHDVGNGGGFWNGFHVYLLKK